MNPVTRPAFNPWPYGIVAVILAFIASIVGVVAFICQHGMDLVSADYYEQEIRYQQRIDQLNRAAALGEPARITFDAAAGILRVQLPRAAGPATGRLQLYRPSAAGLDREFVLAPGTGGEQVFPTPQLAAGAWKARLHWTAQGQDYFTEESLRIPAVPAAR
ncbi:MAG: hypothetical protein RJA22_3069 [Verrucomicrobiota bacterium]|jgi:hypothetical protein